MAIGRATFTDFRLLAACVGELTGGVYLNVGSAVLLPEVFLKAFTVAQNLGADLRDFITVNLDMLAHYRPGENVVRRPAAVGGRGYSLVGRREIMLPLILFPISIPALLGMVDATTSILTGEASPDFWMKLLSGVHLSTDWAVVRGEPQW